MSVTERQTLDILSRLSDDNKSFVLDFVKFIEQRQLSEKELRNAAYLANQTYGEQMLDIIKRKGIPRKTVEVSAEGHIIVDKDKDPELYAWAVTN